MLCLSVADNRVYSQRVLLPQRAPQRRQWQIMIAGHKTQVPFFFHSLLLLFELLFAIDFSLPRHCYQQHPLQHHPTDTMHLTTYLAMASTAHAGLSESSSAPMTIEMLTIPSRPCSSG